MENFKVGTEVRYIGDYNSAYSFDGVKKIEKVYKNDDEEFYWIRNIGGFHSEELELANTYVPKKEDTKLFMIDNDDGSFLSFNSFESLINEIKDSCNNYNDISNCEYVLGGKFNTEGFTVIEGKIIDMSNISIKEDRKIIVTVTQ